MTPAAAACLLAAVGTLTALAWAALYACRYLARIVEAGETS